MSQPALGIIKCPKCKKHFIAAIGTLSAFFSGKKEYDDAVRKMIKAWEGGDRACPYCKNILPAKVWKKNVIDLSSRKKIEKEQGDLKWGITLSPGSTQKDLEDFLKRLRRFLETRGSHTGNGEKEI